MSDCSASSLTQCEGPVVDVGLFDVADFSHGESKRDRNNNKAEVYNKCTPLRVKSTRSPIQTKS